MSESTRSGYEGASPPPRELPTDGRSSATPRGSERRSSVDSSITFVATPDDGTCGIGTYTGDLAESFDGVTAQVLPIDQSAQTVRHFVSLAWRAMATDSDVVHVQHEYGLFRRDGSRWPGIFGFVFFPVLFGLNLLGKKTIVVTFHSVIRPSREEAPVWIRLYLRLMHGTIGWGADHLIFLSDSCERRFRRDVDLPSDRFSRLPHGVHLEGAVDESTARSKRRLGYDPDDDVVMIPGYVRPPKGHDVFVEVARELPEYEFLVAGGGRPAGADLDFAERIQAEAPDNVTVTGVLDDDEFPRAVNAADLALLPYRVTSQSGTFNWCAAQGLPVLASDEPYFTRLEGEWGNVETVDVEDLDGIVAAVRGLVEDEERRAALRERMDRYRRANGFERVGEMHARIYDSCSPSDQSRTRLRRRLSTWLSRLPS